MEIIKSKIINYTEGFLLGFKEPSFQVLVRLDKTVQQFHLSNLVKLDQFINKEPLSVRPDTGCKIVGMIFCRLVNTFYKQVNMPVFSTSSISKTFSTTKPDEVILDIATPAHSKGCAVNIIQATTELINFAAEQHQKNEIINRINNLLKIQTKFLPVGKNVSRILNCANYLNIPVYHMHLQTYQFGMGKFARWLDSSISDKTPQISYTIANNKSLCSVYLKKCGFPVAEHVLCKTEYELDIAAKKIGFPLVVKPLDSDRGDGVTADINDINRLVPAFRRAQKNNQPVMIEKFYEGRDFRIQVVNGKVYWATNRSPAGVNGDGIHSIKELINIENSKRMNSTVLKKIELDDESYELLEQQFLSIDDIPANNQFIKIKSAANVDKGGYRQPVDLSIIHKDNIQLAIDVANALRLDIAGIDLITPDITKSWTVSPSIICEVNGRPMIGEEAVESFLKSIVLGNGRIPITLIVGEIDENLLNKIISDERMQSKSTSMVFSGRVWANGLRVNSMSEGIYNQTMELILNNKTENIVVNIKSINDIKDGLAFDKIANLVLINPSKSLFNNTLLLEGLINMAYERVYLFSDSAKLEITNEVIYKSMNDLSVDTIINIII